MFGEKDQNDRRMDYQALLARNLPGLDEQITIERMQARYEHCQTSMDALRRKVAGVAPTEGRGTFFGTSRLISHTGRLSSPGSFAILSEVGSFGIAFTFLATASPSAGVIILFLVKETLHLQDQSPAHEERESPTRALD